MPWTLDIHTLDVGQGEASIIVARDPTLPARRSILVDGSHASYAPIIHAYMQAAAPAGANLAGPPDILLVTHFDADHSGGVMALLRADNLWHACAAVAAVAAVQAPPGATRPQQIARGAAASAAAAWGAYGANAGLAGPPALAASLGAVGLADAAAADFGVQQTLALMPNAPPLFPTTGQRVRTAARAAGIAAATGIAAAHAGPALVADIRDALFLALRTGVPVESRIDTGGMYQAAQILDIGNVQHIPAQYANIVGGGFLFGANFNVQAPGTARVRATPNIGDEVLFDTGPGAAPPPAGAPAAVVVAELADAWTGIGNPPAVVVSNEPDNDDSIALVVRFDTFSFYTGGDLPLQGEDPIGAAAVAGGLPNPAGGAYPVPNRIAAGKCGHHGAASSTSQNWLNSAQPAGEIISCGPTGKHGHPTNAVVNRLHADANVAFFYLTNDGINNVNVARTQGADQLLTVGNKSRVAGDNNPNNRTPGRNRGHIRLSVTSAQAVNAVRQYTVNYWDQDLAPAPGNRPENTNF
jgi:beta-lactamase superfamily II metal-dependent hydrolase